MALSDQRTRATLRLQVRRELMDANEHLVSPRRWWTDSELNEYLDAWVQDLARHFNMLSTSTTVAIGSNTATVTTPTSMLRISRMLWGGTRLLPTNRLDLDEQHPNWQNEPATTGAKPWQIMEIDVTTSRLYPIPGVAGTVTIIGPRDLSMAADGTTCPLPAWMQFSSRLFVAYQCYLRAGPNQDLRKAGRYKARYERMKKFYRQMLDARFASYGPRLKPGGKYEGAIMVGGGR